MLPVTFEHANTVMRSPKSDDPNFDCQDLPVYRGENAFGQPCFISCWKPNKEELDEIIRTGEIWLQIYGQVHPPVWVGGENPWIKPMDITISANIADRTATGVYRGAQYVFSKLPYKCTELVAAKYDEKRFKLDSAEDGLEDYFYYEPVEVVGIASEVNGFESIMEDLKANHGFDPELTVILKRTSIEEA